MKAGYKPSVLGDIPENWNVLKFGKVFNYVKTYSYSRADLTLRNNDDKILYIHYGDIHATYDRIKLDVKKETRIPVLIESIEVSNDNDYLKNGDLIIADASEDYEGIAKCIEITNISNEKIIGGLHTIIARDEENLTNEGFRGYLLFNVQIVKNLKKIATGTSVYGISKGNLSKLEIPLPPLPEQQKIASILTTVDDKLENIENQISQYSQLKKGLMQQLLTKGIGHTEFVDSPLGMIPKGWKVVKGCDVFSLITKGSSPKWQGFDYSLDGMLFVTSENVKDGCLDISKPKFLPFEFNKKNGNSQLKNGDLLLNIVGASIGRVCIYNSTYEVANINQAVSLLRVNENAVNKYLLYYLQFDETQKRLFESQVGSARQNLSLGGMNKFSLVVPPIPEQQQIANILSSVDDKLELLQNQKGEYSSLKKGLMEQLLTGKVRVKIN